MHYETMASQETPVCPDNQWLLDQLRCTADDPRNTVLAMVTALDAPETQIGLNLVGIHDDQITGDPEGFRGRRLTKLEYEQIKSFEEALTVLCTHSTMNPAEIGEWLGDGSMQELHFKRPIDILFHNFSFQGFDPQAVQVFAAAARPHMQVDDSQYDGLWARWLG